MSPATSTPVPGRNTAPCPGACPLCTITRAAGPSHGMVAAVFIPGSGVSRPSSKKSCPGADRCVSRASSARSARVNAAAAGVAYRGARPRSRDHSTWSQCGCVDQPADGRRPSSRRSAASRASSATVTAGSMSRQPPDPAEPTTTVVVVWSYELVATRTPGVTSVSPLTPPVYQCPDRCLMSAWCGEMYDPGRRAHGPRAEDEGPDALDAEQAERPAELAVRP